MRKPHTHFEQVPVEAAEKILERENLLAKRDGNRQLVVENPTDAPIVPRARSRKSGGESSMKTKKTRKLKPGTFDAEAFLNSAGVARVMREFGKKDTLFSQGDPGKYIMYIQKGGVKISVVSKIGKEAVVGMLGPGDFIGEGGLAGQPLRMATATAITPVSVLVIDNDEMARVLHAEHEFSDRFITYMLGRNIRIEEDLVDQLFNSSEKRLARTLLLLARYGKLDRPQTKLPKIPQETLAEIVGTTRSRINFFMNKFRKMGFITYKDGLQINSSLLSVVLHD